jgi:hypothetical protein
LQRIVEAFKQETAPVRVLVTGDVASEGVSLHSQSLACSGARSVATLRWLQEHLQASPEMGVLPVGAAEHQLAQPVEQERWAEGRSR